MNVAWKSVVIKISGNAGVAFFSSLSGLITVNALTDIKIPVESLLYASLIVAGIQAGLAAFSVLKKLGEQIEDTETTTPGTTSPPSRAVSRVLKTSLLDKILVI